MSERQKRKRRPDAAALPARPAAPRGSRSELRNDEARAALEPLAEGERPAVVTVAAMVAFALALGNLVAWLAGVKIDGCGPPFGNVVLPAGDHARGGLGMWRARYWAVLGHAGDPRAPDRDRRRVGAQGVEHHRPGDRGAADPPPRRTLFWKLVKAMARLQMPERR